MEVEGELGGGTVEGRTAGCWGAGPREEGKAVARWAAQTVARRAMVAVVVEMVVKMKRMEIIDLHLQMIKMPTRTKTMIKTMIKTKQNHIEFVLWRLHRNNIWVILETTMWPEKFMINFIYMKKV